MSQKITLNFKLILLGDANTGKTAILNQYIYHTFTNTKATTGIDFFTKMFQIQDFIVKLSIFDTAGQQRYTSMTKSYFRGTNAVIFTYSLIDKQTFINLPKWIKNFQAQAGIDAMKVVVGTKKDLIQNDLPNLVNSRSLSNPVNSRNQPNSSSSHNQRNSRNLLNSPLINKNNNVQNNENTEKVEEQQVQRLIKNYGITFSFQTSAYLNQNIDEVFEQICKYLIVKQLNNKCQNDIKKTNKQRVQSAFIKSSINLNQNQRLALQVNNKQSKTKSRCC